MGYYCQGQMEVVNALSGETADHISLTKYRSKSDSTWYSEVFKSTAIALTKNSKRLAAAADRETGGEIELAARIFDQGGNKTKEVDIIWTPKWTNVGIIYMANGHRLFAVGSDIYNHRWGWCWDIRTRTRLFRLNIELSGFSDTPLYTTTFGKDPCLIIRLTYTGSTTPSGLKVYSMHGAGLVEHYGDLMVHTICHSGILTLNSETLKLWSHGKKGVKVATLEDEDFPNLLEVKGIVVTENQITLIMEDESFIVFEQKTSEK